MCPENPTERSTGGPSEALAPRLVLQSFEGPLDLLLHLIRSNEISITDIPIVEICRQYDSYLSLMRELDLDVAGEYLVMAATLTHIKSRTLLPAPPPSPGEEPEDPRADLVRQLLDYQRMRAAAEGLLVRDRVQADRYLRGHAGEDPLGPYRQETLLDVSLFDLLSAFKKLVESLGDDQPLHVERDDISVAEKIAWILDRLEGTPALAFEDLLKDLVTRAERIVAFLAILELIRLRLIRASQRRPAGEILLSRTRVAAGPPDEETDA
ncbi:MAG: segregation and condensation protein A [Acidobacteriota bacterium]